MQPKFFSLLAVASLALASTAARAQRSDQVVAVPTTMAATAQQPFSLSAAELTRSMSTRLKLNEGQYVKLYQVNKTRVNELGQIERQYKNDPGARATKLSELETQYEQECSRILTPSQLSQLQRDEKPTQPTTPAGTGNGLG